MVSRVELAMPPRETLYRPTRRRVRGGIRSAGRRVVFLWVSVINPFRSEAEAFRVLLGALAYFGAIGIAAVVGGLWPGLIVFIVLTVGVLLWWLQARRVERPPQT